MLVNFSNVQNIFIVCGHTDMRCGIDGLAGIIAGKYNLDLFDDALFLFCGRKKDRFKALKCTLESRQIKKVYPLGSFWYNINY